MGAMTCDAFVDASLSGSSPLRLPLLRLEWLAERMSHARHEKASAPVAAGVSRSPRPDAAGRALVHFNAARLGNHVRHRIGLEGSEEHSGRAAAEIQSMNPRAAFRLVLAGRILRLRGHAITCAPGEPYPLAVLRVLLSLPDGVREVLRVEVDFLESLGADGAPSAVIRERWADRLSPAPGDEQA